MAEKTEVDSPGFHVRLLAHADSRKRKTGSSVILFLYITAMISGLRVLNLSTRRIASSCRMISTTPGRQVSCCNQSGLLGDMNEPLSSPSGVKRVSYARVKKTPLARSPVGGFKPLKDTSCKEPGTKPSN
ncbi:hypothetical protein ISCGN_004508 [Ixodes scapularis]